MSNEPNDENDDFEPADLGPPAPADDVERRRLVEEAEDREVRREILLGKLAKARSLLYAAEQQGDEAKVAELTQRIADLANERKDL